MHYLHLRKAYFKAKKRMEPLLYDTYRPITDERWIERHFGLYRKTSVLCSCFLCGNPRRFCGEKTLQELRAAEDAEQQTRELTEKTGGAR